LTLLNNFFTLTLPLTYLMLLSLNGPEFDYSYKMTLKNQVKMLTEFFDCQHMDYAVIGAFLYRPMDILG
jgi:hypothetical protein